MKATKEDRAFAEEQLKKMLKPGMTVNCILRHCSASGMSRVIDLCIVHKGEVRRIGGLVSDLVGWSYDNNRQGIKIGGTGMDMGFHLVYTLGRVLYPDGFKLRKNQRGRNGDTSGYDNDGGYAFTSHWL